MNALEEALARREQAGLTEYGDRDDALVTPARSRVRRARTMRTAGWGAAAVAVVGVAVAAIVVAPSAGDRAVEPAGPDGDPSGSVVRAEELLAGAALRTPGLQVDDVRQDALRCDVGAESNPWARADSAPGVYGAECDAVRVGDEQLVRLVPEETTVRVDRTDARAAFTVDWTLQNVSADTTVAVDRGAAVAGLVVGRDTVGTAGPSISNRGFWTASAWLSPSTRLGLLVSDTDPIALAPGETLSGSTVLEWTASDTSSGDEALMAIAFGGAYPDVTVQLRVLPAGAAGDTELLLEATSLTRPEIVVDDAPDGVVADDLLGALRERTREMADALDAQPVLRCEPEPGLDPRWGELDQDGLNVACRSFWASDSPMLELTDLTFTVDGDELDVDYGVRNVAGYPLALDLGATAVAVSTAPEAVPGQGRSVNVDGAALWGDQLWLSNTERYGLIRRAPDVTMLADGGMYAGEARFPLDAVPADGSGEWSVQVPLSAQAGAEEALLLEVVWDGESLGTPPEG